MSQSKNIYKEIIINHNYGECVAAIDLLNTFLSLTSLKSRLLFFLSIILRLNKTASYDDHNSQQYSQTLHNQHLLDLTVELKI